MVRDLFHLMSRSLQMLPLVAMTFLGGCVAQQADMKQTERALQQKLKQQDDQLSQTRARQSQEISMLREQDLPQLRGELEKARHQAEELNARQQDLKDRSVQLGQQTQKLEQLAAKLETDTNTRYVWLHKSLEAQDAKTNERMGKLSEGLDSLDVVIGTILLRIEELEKRLQVIEKH